MTPPNSNAPAGPTDAQRRFTMPAITLWQPWACLVELGEKPDETRAFPIPKRLLGKRVAIHAAKRAPVTNLPTETLDALYDVFGCGWNYNLPRGVIVCTAVLAQSLPADQVEANPFGDYTAGRWAWRLEDVRPVDPHIPATGRQMIGWQWEFPESFDPTAGKAALHD